MRLAFLVVVAGCQPAPVDFPLGGGGGGGPPGGGSNGGGGVDAAPSDVVGVMGHVCVLSDLRLQDVCAPNGVGDLTVTLGTKMTTTADDGSFVIEDPGGNGLTWRVTGADLVTTFEPFGLVPEILAIRAIDYQTLLDDNGVILSPGQGSLVERVFSGAAPLVDGTATVNPAGIKTLYDGTSATQWDQDKTGAQGVIWIPGIAVGTATLTIRPPNNGTPSMVMRPIADQAITFSATGL